MSKPKKSDVSELVIPAPNMETIELNIVGTAPYVQHKFSAKTKKQMLEKQQQGAKAKGKRVNAPRELEKEFEDSMHMDSDGRYGIPAPAFRSAMISACKVVGFVMTRAKLAIFVQPDTFDVDDGTSLVFISGKPEPLHSNVRLETGVASVAVRSIWREWSTKIRITFDADMFSKEDIANLLHRAGLQVGIGEGRPDSKKSNGMGWGTFLIEN